MRIKIETEFQQQKLQDSPMDLQLYLKRILMDKLIKAMGDLDLLNLMEEDLPQKNSKKFSSEIYVFSAAEMQQIRDLIKLIKSKLKNDDRGLITDLLNVCREPDDENFIVD